MKCVLLLFFVFVGMKTNIVVKGNINYKVKRLRKPERQLEMWEPLAMNDKFIDDVKDITENLKSVKSDLVTAKSGTIDRLERALGKLELGISKGIHKWKEKSESSVEDVVSHDDQYEYYYYYTESNEEGTEQENQKRAKRKDDESHNSC